MANASSSTKWQNSGDCLGTPAHLAGSLRRLRDFLVELAELPGFGLRRSSKASVTDWAWWPAQEIKVPPNAGIAHCGMSKPSSRLSRRARPIRRAQGRARPQNRVFHLLSSCHPHAHQERDGVNSAASHDGAEQLTNARRPTYSFGQGSCRRASDPQPASGILPGQPLWSASRVVPDISYWTGSPVQGGCDHLGFPAA